MADWRTGRVRSWHSLSPVLGVFRLMPEENNRFPEYEAGQSIELRRESCKLTRRVTGPDGRPQIVPDLDDEGRQRRGPVAHSYSIASAPWETEDLGWLEFYVALEITEDQYPGRLTESLFDIDPPRDDEVGYLDRIAGDFTLARRAGGARNVVMVGTGTGLAPFAAMVKQLHHEAARGGTGDTRYTLLHANRTAPELAFHERLLEIEHARTLDFVYLPCVSRPFAGDAEDERLGRGRASNVLRLLYQLPTREEEELKLARQGDGDVALAAVERSVKPVLPRHLNPAALRQRLDPARTVILTCGSPSAMSDVRVVAETVGARFEKEDWFVAPPGNG